MHKATRLRVWLGAIVGLGAAIALLVPLLAWAHLPEPMATHWSLRGTPNGSMSRALVLALFGGTILVPAALSWSSTAKPLGAQGVRLVGALAFLSSLVALMSIMNVVANWDRSDWVRAAPLSPGVLVGLLAVPLLVRTLVVKLARRHGLSTEPLPEREASLDLAEGERVFWVGHAENRVALLLVSLPLAVPLLARGAWLAVAICVGVALLSELFTRIRVTVSGQRLTIFYGHLGWVRQRIRVSRIQRASTFELVPMAHGGWGYRGSLTLLRRAAVVVRRGMALRLELLGARQLAITVDDAKAGAELINGLVERGKVTSREPAELGRWASST